MKVVLWVFVGLFAAFMLFGFVGRASDPLTHEKDVAREAIAMCQKNQDDALTPMDQRRFIRGACDKMREDYQTRFGRAP